MTAAADLYPLSSQDGKAIPLDIVKPLSCTAFTMVADTAAAITIPAGYTMVWVYSTVPCFLRLSATALPNAPVSGTEYADTTFIPSDTPMTLMVTAGSAYLLGLDTGLLVMNSIEQWAAIAQTLQSTSQ